ncbi:MAG: helix-turn-helix transcriptional regulator [Erysipelotrichia bacterium]|nr:helix-turn-helix transcriptional regulator [Erysipelotrichia bacterium]
MILPIAERIKILRTNASMTQTQLVNRLGVTKPSVNACEMGISIPTSDKFVEIAILFGTTTDYIFGLENRKMCDSSNINPDIRAILENLINYLNNLNHKNDN